MEFAGTNKKQFKNDARWAITQFIRSKCYVTKYSNTKAHPVHDTTQFQNFLVSWLHNKLNVYIELFTALCNFMMLENFEIDPFLMHDTFMKTF